jgi:hypothetical protein
MTVVFEGFSRLTCLQSCRQVPIPPSEGIPVRQVGTYPTHPTYPRRRIGFGQFIQFCPDVCRGGTTRSEIQQPTPSRRLLLVFGNSRFSRLNPSQHRYTRLWRFLLTVRRGRLLDPFTPCHRREIILTVILGSSPVPLSADGDNSRSAKPNRPKSGWGMGLRPGRSEIDTGGCFRGTPLGGLPFHSPYGDEGGVRRISLDRLPRYISI